MYQVWGIFNLFCSQRPVKLRPPPHPPLSKKSTSSVTLPLPPLLRKNPFIPLPFWACHIPTDTHTHTPMHAATDAHTRTHTHTHTLTCTPTRVSVCVCILLPLLLKMFYPLSLLSVSHTYRHTHGHVCIHTHTHTYTLARVCVCVYHKREMESQPLETYIGLSSGYHILLIQIFIETTSEA